MFLQTGLTDHHNGTSSSHDVVFVLTFFTLRHSFYGNYAERVGNFFPSNGLHHVENSYSRDVSVGNLTFPYFAGLRYSKKHETFSVTRFNGCYGQCFLDNTN